MKVPQSLRDIVEGAESLVQIEDLSCKKGVLQLVNPLVKLVAITFMIVASLFIYQLSFLFLTSEDATFMTPFGRIFIRSNIISANCLT